MAKSNAFKMSLPAVDDLFSTEESRQEEKLKKIYELPISEIDDFPEHPYRVLDDEDMTSLMDSISERGIIRLKKIRILSVLETVFYISYPSNSLINKQPPNSDCSY